MRESFKSAFDHRYLMRPWGGNSILFTAEYAALTYDTSDALTKQQVELAIISFLITAADELPSGESFSHDDMTAVVCLSKLYDLKYHKNVNMHKLDLRSRLHPRDIIFYLYSLGGIYRLLVYPLMPLLTLIMMESVLNTSYKNIDGRAVIATDGVLLSWLRLHTFDMPITKFIMEKCLSFKGTKWSDYFLIYFGKSHPNTILILEKENV